MEMWDKEPDARITSGCARDRMHRISEAIIRYHKINEFQNNNDNCELNQNSCFINLESNNMTLNVFESINLNSKFAFAKRTDNSVSYNDTRLNSTPSTTKIYNNNYYFHLPQAS